MSDRFARQEIIPDWQQGALRDATVIIIGMGALGNEVARLLAFAGVGRLILCDHDIIESSNLSRMALFAPSDIGDLKVEVAARRLQAVIPEVTIDTRPDRLEHGVGLAELRDANLVMSCLDSNAARLRLVGRCQLVGAPYIDGGTHPWGGEVRPYLQRDIEAPCFGCSLMAHERAVVDEPWSCLDNIQEDPTEAAIPSSAIVGAWMGTLAVRYLMGLEQADKHASLIIDIPRGRTYALAQERDPTCMMHDRLGPVERLPVTNRDTVATLLAALPPDAVPIVYTQIQERQVCRRCRFERDAWHKIPAIEVCPNCGGEMFPRETIEIHQAPGGMRLAALGVAPREIMPVYIPDDDQGFAMHLYELAE